MTASQRKSFYFGECWAPTAKRLDWREEGGRLVADLDAQLIGAQRWPEHAATAVAAVIVSAQAAAKRERRAVSDDDLRHACNEIASGGKTDSSTKFNQRMMNHFDRLCAVLRDPWDMNAEIAWNDPAEDDRKRTVEYLKKLAHEARMIAIAKRAWGITDWETCSQSQLDWMVQQVKPQPKYGRRPELARRPF